MKQTGHTGHRSVMGARTRLRLYRLGLIAPVVLCLLAAGPTGFCEVGAYERAP